MPPHLTKTFLWPDDDELCAIVQRALRLTDAIDPEPEQWPEVFRACFTLASQCQATMSVPGAGLDLSRLGLGG